MKCGCAARKRSVQPSLCYPLLTMLTFANICYPLLTIFTFANRGNLTWYLVVAKSLISALVPGSSLPNCRTAGRQWEKDSARRRAYRKEVVRRRRRQRQQVSWEEALGGWCVEGGIEGRRRWGGVRTMGKQGEGTGGHEGCGWGEGGGNLGAEGEGVGEKPGGGGGGREARGC